MSKAKKSSKDYETLRTIIQLCCDGSSEDDPATLLAKTINQLITERDKAVRLLARLLADKKLVYLYEYEAHFYFLPDYYFSDVEKLVKKLKAKRGVI